jgi:hypothetical protein
MPDATRFEYKGYLIAVRCRQVPFRRDADKPMFRASFVVSSAGEQPWQEFPPEVFGTAAEARENALKAAQTSVDAMLLTQVARRHRSLR